MAKRILYYIGGKPDGYSPRSFKLLCTYMAWVWRNQAKDGEKRTTEIIPAYKGDEYRCSACNERYLKGRSDEEAMAQSAHEFGHHDLQELEILCDDCYREINELYEFRTFDDAT